MSPWTFPSIALIALSPILFPAAFFIGLFAAAKICKTKPAPPSGQKGEE